MKIVLDTHTHTYVSGHAYNTMNEMAHAASCLGLELLCITDHAPKMPGSATIMHFLNLKACPRTKYGIRLAFGVEANILDYEGNIDMPEDILERMDLCIASIHPPCFQSGTVEENTNAYLGVMKNPHVNIIGHPDDGRFPVDYSKLVHAAKENHVALEVNNSSLKPGSFRPGARDNYKKMLTLCKEFETPITLGSDAHVEEDIADFALALELLKELDFPEKLVLNSSVEKLQKFIDEKKATC